jgi:hypothetical protein
MPSARPMRASKARRPRRDNAVDHGIVLPLHAIGDRVARDAAQSGDHLGNGDVDARHVDRTKSGSFSAGAHGRR